MTPISKFLTSHVRPFQTPCYCVGPCTGYDSSSSSCPPLIVLAVIANCETSVQVSDASESRNEH